MVSTQYEIAMSETLHYLKGIRKEDVDKIPKKMMNFLQENASKDYKCDFDYTKPLSELNLQQETRGIIGCICLNCWCETEEQKNAFMKNLKENEKIFQEQLSQKYSAENLFEGTMPVATIPPEAMPKNKIVEKEESLIVKKESFWIKIKNYLKSIFK